MMHKRANAGGAISGARQHSFPFRPNETTVENTELLQDKQREIVARGDRNILAAAKEIRAAKTAARRAQWEARILALSNRAAPLPRDRRWPILLADPPYHFAAYSAASGRDRSAERHYPTLSIAEICELPVADLVTSDAALFLWCTSPRLPDGLRVMDAWGFEYRSSLVWIKDRFGLGYWVRSQHEHLLIGVRGKMRSPLPAARPSSVVVGARREHSRKPDEIYTLIEAAYPNLPKIELFARAARPGWDCWGNEAPATTSAIPPASDFLLGDGAR
jgi:N6-adenosine-specific RNA methylase IME4